ncbi:MAG: T9SS type A sorting domain-containing protein [Candidatus Cloacimonetes bacterium]|jgi:hypothetical protein|nr:T9SS type A sorting domain-containing protein [Candidatus Cloacimonadota bacterium]MDD2505874.1 T9SS type A sorting domain-containing protein [Candidatus Cloacimonadota bacterium]MDD4147568.1 T9SS type A sorting domain-containing protein [Candidatus Cloacimonadota bacterium]MDD4559285.1 T9SS type A sorting domain-containing protein [Candidatus Cloacimonadota bacterium]
MKKALLLFVIAGTALLSAQMAPYYPTTSMVENFGASWCEACEFAQQGLDVIEAEVNPGEIIIPRLLTESGPYSNPEIAARFQHYEVLGYPAVIFNGKIRVNGSDEPVMDGSLYREALNQFRYLGSPLKMTVESYDHNSGNYSFKVIMVNDEIAIADAEVVFYLVEDNLPEDLTRIVRTVQSQPISIAGAGNFQVFNFSIVPDPAWNLANVWATAFVQMPQNTILQAVSTLPQPEHQIRVAVPFDLKLSSEVTGDFFSPYFHVFNLGPAATLNIHVEILNAPEDWYINYCDEEGACLPGSMTVPHSVDENGHKTFDLNIQANSEGRAFFDFVIETTGAEPYRIPFELTVGEVSADDPLAVPSAITVQKAWPNPFSDILSFDVYNVKAGSSSGISIYNARGQKVSSLKLDNLQEGLNQVSWDAGDLPSGLYFYKTGAGAKSGKILKIR